MTALFNPRLPAPTRSVVTPPWRRRLGQHMHRAGWLGALGLVLLPLMLMAFYQVMRSSVTQAQVRHASAAAQAEAQWLCRISSARQPCGSSSESHLEGPGAKAAIARISTKVN